MCDPEVIHDHARDPIGDPPILTATKFPISMRSDLTFLLLALSASTTAQTLFTEDFESAPVFTLNTSDANSVSGVSNTWLINTVFAGGAVSTDCLGLPLDFDIPATPSEPVGIATPNGNYLHTASVVAIASGVQCCSFGGADGLCTQADDIFARMTSDVSTVGFADVSLRFWWLCNGGVQNYGEVYYSTNAGTSWTQLTAPLAHYMGTTNWGEQTISNVAFGDQATLRIGFRFHNGVALLQGGSDPGFSIDDVRIIASTTSSIAATVSPLIYCQNSSLVVPYTINGTFNAGNVFTAQLSDASGGFASPVNIGLVASTTAGMIVCLIPPGTPPGSGYRIRITSSTPAITGMDNGANITVNDAPFAGNDDVLSICSGNVAVSIGLGGDAGGIWTGPSTVINDLYDPGSMDPGTYTYTTSGVAPCFSDQATMVVTELPGANAGNSQVAIICKNTGLYELFDFLTGSPDATGTWTGPNGQPFSGTFDSMSSDEGIYTYTVAPGGSCPSDESVVTVQLGEPGNAGPDNDWSVCSDQAPVNLYALLTNANLTGIWFHDGTPFNGTTDQGGSFVYIDYATPPCQNDTALITLAMQQATNAGQNATVTVCANGSPVVLLNALGGTPDPGGVWTGPDNTPHSGILIPAVDQAGLYTYTVPAIAPCASDEAVLAVIIDPCTGIAEFNASPLRLSWTGRGADGTYTFASTSSGEFSMAVIDVNGRLVRDERMLLSGVIRIGMEDQASGLYTLRIIGQGRAGAVRFVHSGE